MSEGSPIPLRSPTQALILRTIRDAGTISRAGIVRATGLAAPTATKIVGELLQAGLVEEIGTGKSAGGRPAGRPENPPYLQCGEHALSPDFRTRGFGGG